jgi:hypothetical protein
MHTGRRAGPTQERQMTTDTIQALRENALNLYDVALAELAIANPNTEPWMREIMESATTIIGIVGRLTEAILDATA